MRWRLILKGYNSELIYIQGYIAADTPDRLEIMNINNPIKPNMSLLMDHFSVEKDDFLHPVKLLSNINKTKNL